MLRERKDLEGPPEMYSSQRQEKKPTKTVSRIQDLRKQDSIKKNKRNAGFLLKSHCCLMKDRIKFLAEDGQFDSEWFSKIVWNQDFSCMLQRGVFEDLVINTI